MQGICRFIGSIQYIIEGGSGDSMAKGFSKLLKSPKFIGMLYTLRVKLPSLTPK